MNIFFSGIGGVGVGPLAEIAHDAGYSVQGSDLHEGRITRELRERGIPVSIGQDGTFLRACHEEAPIDWFVYTSALPADHPELVLARELGIKVAKRDELLAHIIGEKHLKLIAVAGTHGKTTTTGMLVWVMQQLGVPVSYSVGSTLTFGPSGRFDPASEYFIYECDEFDRNFLHFFPHLSVITSVDYDHPDTYPTPEEYFAAFSQFVAQSDHTILWETDARKLTVGPTTSWVLGPDEVRPFKLTGDHNRRNATLVAKAVEYLGFTPARVTARGAAPAEPSKASEEGADAPTGPAGAVGDITAAVQKAIASFPGTDRRFERLADNLYSDYGHHPVEIAATLQLARELSDHVVLIYQPHQNVRQHEIRSQYTDCFELAEKIIWLPTYLSREDPSLPILTPDELSVQVTNRAAVTPGELDDALWDTIQRSRDEGKLVLAMGAGSIDGWLRDQLAIKQVANVLVINTDGNFVLQQCDDKPTINNPGMITGFGGAVEDGETLRAAAARELREETNLAFDPDQLTYHHTLFQPLVNDGTSRWVTYFTLKDMDISQLEVYEGQGFITISPADDLDDYNLSPIVRQALDAYSDDQAG